MPRMCQPRSEMFQVILVLVLMASPLLTHSQILSAYPALTAHPLLIVYPFPIVYPLLIVYQLLTAHPVQVMYQILMVSLQILEHHVYQTKKSMKVH